MAITEKFIQIGDIRTYFNDKLVLLKEDLMALEDCPIKEDMNIFVYETFEDVELDFDRDARNLHILLLNLGASITPSQQFQQYAMIFSVNFVCNEMMRDDVEYLLKEFAKTTGSKVEINGQNIVEIYDLPTFGVVTEFQGYDIINGSMSADFTFLTTGITSEDVKLTIDGDEIPHTGFAIVRSKDTAGVKRVNTKTFKNVSGMSSKSISTTILFDKQYDVVTKFRNDILRDDFLNNVYTVQLSDNTFINNPEYDPELDLDEEGNNLFPDGDNPDNPLLIEEVIEYKMLLTEGSYGVQLGEFVTMEINLIEAL